MRMPEEVNRVLTDHVARLLFCPTRSAVENLRREGITRGAVHMGDVMYDAALTFGELAGQQSNIQADLGLTPQNYCLATIHRAENTDDPGRLRGILEALAEIASPAMPLILPLHPRTRGCIYQLGLASVVDKNPCIRVIEPVSFLDMVMLEKHALLILTDSGGVQKEAYFHGVPCVTLRDETEWVETVEAGWNTVAGAAKDTILKAAAKSRKGKPIPEYGNGHAAAAVVAGLVGFDAAAETIPA
jgi:UDP-GlcNAc3NAcA epimerase